MTKPTGKGRGRPPGPPVDLLGVRIPVSLLKPLAEWAESKGLSRQEAIRRLVAKGLDHPAEALDEPDPDPSMERDVMYVASGGPPSVLNMLRGPERALVLAPVVRALLASNVKGLGALRRPSTLPALRHPRAANGIPRRWLAYSPSWGIQPTDRSSTPSRLSRAPSEMAGSYRTLRQQGLGIAPGNARYRSRAGPLSDAQGRCVSKETPWCILPDYGRVRYGNPRKAGSGEGLRLSCDWGCDPGVRGVAYAGTLACGCGN
jgi:hypothetical protein